MKTREKGMAGTTGLESGYARDKVKVLISKLEAKGFIERKRPYVGNLKSKRILRCLKFVRWTDFQSIGPKGVFSVNRKSAQ